MSISAVCGTALEGFDERYQSCTAPRSRIAPQVLVLGGGFAGIGAARKLRKHEVDVVIVDGHGYHTFQPLLYQVATDLLPPITVGHPLRDLFDEQPNARVHSTDVTSVNLEKRRVDFAEMDPLEYDYLVLALGAVRPSTATATASPPQTAAHLATASAAATPAADANVSQSSGQPTWLRVVIAAAAVVLATGVGLAFRRQAER